MKKIIALLFFALPFTVSAQFSSEEKSALKKEAQQITIIKDKYGVPHVYTKTDAQAVFGMSYVQCEEFFEKVETSLINRLGRQSELEGEPSIYKDLWSRMFTDSVQAKVSFEKSPKWLQKLCIGFAGGINYYMISHAEKKPKLITRVEPWMCLMNDIPAVGGSNIDEEDFVALYSKNAPKFTSYLPLNESNDMREPQDRTAGLWRLQGQKVKMPCF